MGRIPYQTCGGKMTNEELLAKVLVALNNKTDIDQGNAAANVDYVVERGGNSTSWYEIYRSGWLVQGGKLIAVGDGIKTITFLKPYSDANYTISRTNFTTSTSTTTARGEAVYSNDASSFSVILNQTYTPAMYWCTAGWGAGS